MNRRSFLATAGGAAAQGPPPARSTMDQPARLELEQANVRQSLDYARDHLGLRPGA